MVSLIFSCSVMCLDEMGLEFEVERKGTKVAADDFVGDSVKEN